MNRRVYLAGPGVFRPDSHEHGRSLIALCERYSMYGLYPGMSAMPQGPTRSAMARSIFEFNCKLIDRADIVVADISPFRGPNMAPGTAWEIGYAIRAGKPVIAYTSEAKLLYARTILSERVDLGGVDRNGWTIENFGLCENLMIACCVSGIYESAEEAIAQAAI